MHNWKLALRMYISLLRSFLVPTAPPVWYPVILLLIAFSGDPMGQVKENCVVGVLNGTVEMNPADALLPPCGPPNFDQVCGGATLVVHGATTEALRREP